MASIRKRGNRWQVQVRRQGHPPISKSFIRRADAEAWARAIEAAFDRGAPVTDLGAPRDMTFADLLRRYRDQVTPCKRGAASERYRLDAVLRTPMAALPLVQLTPAVVAVHRDDRLRVVSVDTVRRELGLLRHVLEIARHEWGVPLPSNPFAAIDRPNAGLPRERRPSPLELTRLQEALVRTRNPDLRDALDLAIETGLRRGELLALTWDAVDLARRTARIPVTKTGRPRVIPLSMGAVRILAARRSSAASGKVFALTANALRLAWERLRQRAGLSGLRWHDFRHEAISRFVERGLSTPEVALISGHRDLRMLARYVHLRAEELARKLDDAP